MSSGSVTVEDKVRETKTYKAIRIKSWSLEPEVIDIGFKVYDGYDDKEWISPLPGVTGYESGPLRSMVEEYIDKPVFSRWIACAGTLNKYDRLEIPMSEIVKYLEDNERIIVEREYGYIKKVTWL